MTLDPLGDDARAVIQRCCVETGCACPAARLLVERDSLAARVSSLEAQLAGFERVDEKFAQSQHELGELEAKALEVRRAWDANQEACGAFMADPSASLEETYAATIARFDAAIDSMVAPGDP